MKNIAKWVKRYQWFIIGVIVFFVIACIDTYFKTEVMKAQGIILNEEIKVNTFCSCLVASATALIIAGVAGTRDK